jgi:hypothetical protein
MRIYKSPCFAKSLIAKPKTNSVTIMNKMPVCFLYAVNNNRPCFLGIFYNSINGLLG